MQDIQPLFFHISEEKKTAAVTGFVSINPHMRGIDFYTMMEILIDSDSYLPILGDVDIREPENAENFVNHFVAMASEKE